MLHVDRHHEGPGPGRLAVLGNQDPDRLDLLDPHQQAEGRVPDLCPAPLENRLPIFGRVVGEGRLDELLDLRHVECLGVADPNDPHPRLTHDAPSDPWNFAPAAPSET